METYGNLRHLIMVTYSNLWQPMGGNLWHLMTTYGTLWHLMTSCGTLWHNTATYDNLSKLMTTYCIFFIFLILKIRSFYPHPMPFLSSFSSILVLIVNSWIGCVPSTYTLFTEKKSFAISRYRKCCCSDIGLAEKPKFENSSARKGGQQSRKERE